MHIHNNQGLLKHIISLAKVAAFLILLSTIRPLHAQTPSPEPTVEHVTHNGCCPVLQELLMIDTQCTLPCFWGFQPDKTKIADLRQFISIIDDDAITNQLNEIPFVRSDGLSIYDFWLSFDPTGHLRIDFIIDNDELRQIYVDTHNPQEWLHESMLELPTLLNELGQPTDVFILFAIQPFNQLGISMTLVYNDTGVMARYAIDFPVEEMMKEDEPLHICPRFEYTRRIELWFQSPDTDMLVEENLSDLRMERTTRPDLPLEVITELNTNTFTEILTKESGDRCFEAISLDDIRGMGYEL